MDRVIEEQGLVQQPHRARVAATAVQGVPVAGRRVSRPTRIEGLVAGEARDARGSGGRGRASGDSAHERHHKGSRGNGGTHAGNRLPLADDPFCTCSLSRVLAQKGPPAPSPSGPAGSLAPVRILGKDLGGWMPPRCGPDAGSRARWRCPLRPVCHPYNPTLPPRCHLLLTRFSPGIAQNKHAR